MVVKLFVSTCILTLGNVSDRPAVTLFSCSAQTCLQVTNVYHMKRI